MVDSLLNCEYNQLLLYYKLSNKHSGKIKVYSTTIEIRIGTKQQLF